VTHDRTAMAADLLRIDPEKVKNVPREVQAKVRAMTPAQRANLTNRIDGAIEWIAAYEAEEARMSGEGDPE
jgi:hypothetical protein